MKKFRLIYLAATTLLFAACVNEDEGVGRNSPVAAIVRADIAQNINTRATTSNLWTVGDAIGVYITSASNTTHANNVKYVATDENGGFASETPIYFMDNKEQDFIAYYPYQEETDNIDENGWLKNDWNIDYSDPSKTLAYDFLFAGVVKADKDSPMVDFKDTNESGENEANKDHRFKHKMAMVEFNITTGFGVDGDYNTLKSIVLKGIKSTGKINVKTGAYDIRDATAASQTMTIGKKMENAINCQFILFPQTIENNKLDLEFQIKLGEETINTYTTSISLTDKGFESGKKYTYNVTVKNTSISIENASIVAWQDYDQGVLDADFQ